MKWSQGCEGPHLGFDFPVEEENFRGIFLVWEGGE